MAKKLFSVLVTLILDLIGTKLRSLDRCSIALWVVTGWEVHRLQHEWRSSEEGQGDDSGTLGWAVASHVIDLWFESRCYIVNSSYYLIKFSSLIELWPRY